MEEGWFLLPFGWQQDALRPQCFRIAPDRPSACYEAAPVGVIDVSTGRGPAMVGRILGIEGTGVVGERVMFLLDGHCTRLLISTPAKRRASLSLPVSRHVSAVRNGLRGFGVER